MYKWLVQVMDKNYNWSVLHMTNDWDEAISHAQTIGLCNLFEGCRVVLNREFEA